MDAPENPSLRIRPATAADLNGVAGLLRDSSLPTDGIEALLDTLMVAELDGFVVACAGLECFGNDALLRSVAVAASVRGRGIGTRIVAAAVERARRESISRLYLLTETAEDFFSPLEFSRVDRTDVSEAVKGSAEFTLLCPETAVAMMRRL